MEYKNHKMVDLKMTKTEKKNRYSPVAADTDKQNYSWDTEMDLDTRLIKKLGVEDMESGDMVYIHAVGKIIRKQVTDQGSSDKTTSMAIQFQKMQVMSEEDENTKMRKEVAKEVYDD